MPKQCKLCGKKRYANLSICFLHHREREKAKREERKRKKLARRLGSKKYEESKRKILRKKLDIAFSRLVRSLGKCERCGLTDYPKLQTSHIFSRANLAVRWDPLNANCLCAGCHFWWHQNPAEAVEWLKTIYTTEQFLELRQRALAYRRWTVPELEALLIKITNLWEHPDSASMRE